MLLGFQHSETLWKHTWIKCDGVLSTLSDQGGCSKSPSPGRAQLCGICSASTSLPGSLGVCVPLQEGATEAKQLSQRARSQLRGHLVWQTPPRMEETLLGRLFESCGQEKGLEMQKSEPAGLGPRKDAWGKPSALRKCCRRPSPVSQWHLLYQVDDCNACI